MLSKAASESGGKGLDSWNSPTQTALLRKLRDGDLVHKNELHLISQPSYHEDTIHGNLTFQVVSTKNVHQLQWIMQHNIDGHIPATNWLDPERIWQTPDGRAMVSFSMSDVFTACFGVTEMTETFESVLSNYEDGTVCHFRVGFFDHEETFRLPVLGPEMTVTAHHALIGQGADKPDHGQSAESGPSPRMKKAVSFDSHPPVIHHFPVGTSTATGYPSTMSGSASVSVDPSVESPDLDDYDQIWDPFTMNYSNGVIARALHIPNDEGPPALVPRLDIAGSRRDRGSAAAVNPADRLERDSTPITVSGESGETESSDGTHGSRTADDRIPLRAEPQKVKRNGKNTNSSSGSLFIVGGGMVLVGMIAAYICCAKTDQMVKMERERAMKANSVMNTSGGKAQAPTLQKCERTLSPSL